MTFCCQNSLRRREQDQRQLHRQVVLQLRADVLIRALGIAGDAFEMRLNFRVVVDLEVFGLVGVPLEVVVADLVLAEVGDITGLRQRKAGRAGQRQHGREQPRPRRQRLPQRGTHNDSLEHLTDPETTAAIAVEPCVTGQTGTGPPPGEQDSIRGPSSYTWDAAAPRDGAGNISGGRGVFTQDRLISACFPGGNHRRRWNRRTRASGEDPRIPGRALRRGAATDAKRGQGTGPCSGHVPEGHPRRSGSSPAAPT